MENENFIEVYIDGAARGNPGKSGIGVFIIFEGNRNEEIKEYIGISTNNNAEYNALIKALQALKNFPNHHIIINTDSQLLANQINGLWKVKNSNIKLLYRESMNLLKSFKNIQIQHIGRENNSDADRLANEAINEYDINSAS